MNLLKKLVFGIFFLLVILNLTLFLVYRNRLKTAKVKPPSEYKEEPQPKSEIITPTQPIIKIIPGDIDKGLLKEVEVEGVIQENPIFDQKTKEATMIVSFRRANNKPIMAQVILGKSDDSILTLLAKDFVIGAYQEWKERSVSQLLSLLKKSDPVRVRFYLQKAPNSLFDNPGCDVSCKEKLKRIDGFFEANSLFFEALNSSKPVQESFKIGAVSALVVSTSD